MDRELAGPPELYKINNPEAMLEIATLNAQFKLETSDNILPEEKIVAPAVEQTGKADKTTVLDQLRGTKLGRVAALAGTVIALAAAGSIAKDAIAPTKAKAVEECTYEEVASPDGKSTSYEKVCSSDGIVPSDKTSQPQPETQREDNKNQAPQKKQQERQKEKKERAEERRKDQKERRKARKQRKANSQKGFPGYDMEDSRFTDKNGCFITAAASSLRRETGKASITPQRIYHPALRKMWSPGTGVKGGFLFTALDEMAAPHNVGIRHTDSFKVALKAKKNGDEVVIRAGAGYFTDGGHYMAVKGVTRNGKRIIIDDSNGKGKHGDSERKGGWNGKQLSSGGVLDYHILHLRGVK